MSVRARDIMTSEVESVGSDEEISTVLTRLSRAEFNGFPVVDDGQLVGIVTQGDLVDLFQPSDRTLWIPIGFPPFIEPIDYAFDFSWDDLDVNLDLAKHAGKPISTVMTEDVVTVEPDASLDEVLSVLADAERDINRVPVIDDDEIVGIITREDLLRTLDRERE
ncbi:CBS domain containing membrane protein [Halococcus morrhuae DSM 1307]|uniref:CBS domain containing membrane protein n=1 Tax=Halococcus morrhuae DSM 1307 TaxID=931277 RepID=M0ML43_HALMO|nr:CBS domain-containing protein [Halococcus morrhuae]EMA46386.1 CBS domain containing membrane protein [Halococcus morrhuae DSM 1307]